MAGANAEAVESLLDAANAAIQGTARLFHGLSALPADHGEQLVWASHYIRNADSAERAVVAAGIVVGDMRRAAELLGRIPANADSGMAMCELVTASGQQIILQALTAELEDMMPLVHKCDALRPDIGMMPRRATLLLTQASTAGGKRIEAESELAGMSGLLARLNGARDAEDATLIYADTLLMEASNLWEMLRDTTILSDEMSKLLTKLLAATYAQETSSGNVKFAEEEIERYKREHPVCPECGAEQKHWHVA